MTRSLLAPLLLLAGLCGCAARPPTTPPAAAPVAEELQPLDPSIKPLTVEQEEAVSAAN